MQVMAVEGPERSETSRKVAIQGITVQAPPEELAKAAALVTLIKLVAARVAQAPTGVRATGEPAKAAAVATTARLPTAFSI
jgi:hypothetical protein